MSDTDEENPEIMFGNEWIPASEAWKKVEIAQVVTDAIDKFNENFPDLSTEVTRSVVPLVRQRISDMELRMPSRPVKTPELEDTAIELLQNHSPEEAVEILTSEHGWNGNLMGLIYLVGEDAYLGSLKREFNELTTNMISPEQIATLWTEARRPVPSGGLWSAAKVKKLMEST